MALAVFAGGLLWFRPSFFIRLLFFSNALLSNFDKIDKNAVVFDNSGFSLK
jgi:hypothetical protein